MIQQDDIRYLPDTVSDAFHGTGAEDVSSIIADGFTKTKSIEYLGDGVYFYVGSMEDAKYFAVRRRRKRKYAVLQATVLLGFCLKLGVSRHRSILARISERVAERNEARTLMVQHGLSHLPLAVAINILGTEFVRIDTVLGAQVNDESEEKRPEPYAKSKMWFYYKDMLCVRNQSNIKQLAVVNTNAPDLYMS